MTITVDVTKEEEILFEEYAERHGMTVEEAFREALFEKIMKELGKDICSVK